MQNLMQFLINMYSIYMHFESHTPYLPPRNPPGIFLAHLYLLVVAVHNQKTAHKPFEEQLRLWKAFLDACDSSWFQPNRKTGKRSIPSQLLISSLYSSEHVNFLLICSSLSTSQKRLVIKAHCDPTANIDPATFLCLIVGSPKPKTMPPNPNQEIKKPWGRGLSWSMTSIYCMGSIVHTWTFQVYQNCMPFHPSKRPKKKFYIVRSKYEVC